MKAIANEYLSTKQGNCPHTHVHTQLLLLLLFLISRAAREVIAEQGSFPIYISVLQGPRCNDREIAYRLPLDFIPPPHKFTSTKNSL